MTPTLAALICLAIGMGQCARIVHHLRADTRRQAMEAEADRIHAAWAELDEIEGVHIGGRWPARQTTTDLADAYDEPVWLPPLMWCQPPDWYVSPLDTASPRRADSVPALANRPHVETLARGLLTYPGQHRADEPVHSTTAEFHQIVRDVTFDDEMELAK